MMRFLTAGGVAAACLLAAAVAVVCAKPGTVQLKGGQQYNGDVTEKGDDVIITNNKIDTVVKKSNVDHIDYFENFADQFHTRLKKLKKDDAKGRYDLARWAFDNHEYELSRLALREAIEIDPNFADAVQFNEAVRRQMELEKKAHGGDEDATTREAASQPANGGGERVLTPADINIIRQKEIKQSDTNVRIRFENDVERRFANAMSIDPGRFRNLKPLDKFLEIQRQNDTAFLQDVKILSDPSAIMDYKKDVQRAVLAGCASSGCHGGPNGGRFVLISPADNDSSVYTNFYILQTYMQRAKEQPGGNKHKAQDDGGIFGGGSAEHPMINRTRPDESILLQYGLPAEMSDFDHPDVQGYRGAFKSRNDPRYKQIRAWIASLRVVDPDYGIDFKPAVGRAPASAPAPGGAATQPATRASSKLFPAEE